MRVESVESVEGGHAGLAHEGLLLGVDPDVDLDSGHSVVTSYSLGIPGHLEGVGGEELLAALLAPVLVVAGVGPLVGAQVAWRDITCNVLFRRRQSSHCSGSVLT